MSGYIGNIPVPQATQTRQSFTATASQTTFNTAGYSVGYVDVFLNGVKLAPADYTATNGSDIILAVGAASGDILEIVAYEIFQVVDQDFTGDFTVDGTTFVVDSTNNRVGIGTSSPDSLLELEASAGARLRLTDTGTQSYTIGNTGTSFNIYNESQASEAMRIDSSGNLLVGKTSADGVTTAGHQFNSTGYTAHVRNNGVVSQFNRQTSDGDILQFYKDGTTVGSILATSGDLGIGTGDTGVRFSDSTDSIYPITSTTGFSRDAAVDIGYSTVRFKDLYLSGGVKWTEGQVEINSTRLLLRSTGDASGLRFDGSNYTPFKNGSEANGTVDLGYSGGRYKDLYLSGGVYLGGTGAANKLDDYEEGTYTVTMTPQYGTFTLNSGQDLAKYVKIGSLVYVSGQVRLSSVSGVSGAHVSFSLPFANSTGNEISHNHWNSIVMYNSGYTNRDQGLWIYDSNSFARFLDSNYNYIPPGAFSGNEEIIFSFTYRTDA